MLLPILGVLPYFLCLLDYPLLLQSLPPKISPLIASLNSFRRSYDLSLYHLVFPRTMSAFGGRALHDINCFITSTRLV